ncbi:MAG: response regulator [Tenuifilaceae bacterium]
MKLTIQFIAIFDNNLSLPMNNTKILIVDDDPLISEFLIHILEQLNNGYIFFKAINGKLGIEVALEVIPDLIIMDWEMPVMIGIEATKILKSTKETANIPIIIATGVMNSSKNLKIALDAGAVDYIRKPFDKYEVQARVNSALMLANSWKTVIAQQEQIMRNENEKLTSELEFRSKELINHSIFITRSLQKTDKILDQIKGLYPYLNKTGNKLLETIIKENSFNVSQTFWTDFEFHFDEIYPGFFKKLLAKHPDLTPSERKLCAFLRLNMSTKDIASITFVDPQSINIARSRLRASLYLEREANLFNYLVSFS